MSLLQLTNASLELGGHKLLDKASLSIEPRMRLGLCGRNGEGKSSLLKLMLGDYFLSQGELVLNQGLNVSLLSQGVPHDFNGSVVDLVSLGLGKLGQLFQRHMTLSMQEQLSREKEHELNCLHTELDKHDAWNIGAKVEKVLSQLSLEGTGNVNNLSGGMKRRVLLAQALVSEPELLLLDEPTNHLDIAACEHLESLLKGFACAYVVVSHDRRFLDNVTNEIVELDRGKLYLYHGNYDNFLRRREERLNAEEQERKRFNKKLQQEECWVRQGIKARRTRNEGRVRALKKLRQEKLDQRNLKGIIQGGIQKATQSGKVLFEIEALSYFLNDKPIIYKYSTLVMRGDKIALMGPNGCGKSTLLKLLLGEIQPTSGSVKTGTQLEVAYFDQHRAQLDDSLSVIDNVAGGQQRVTINGKEKHVISYLQDFLFSPDRINAPISKLSGGERNRLLLAKLFIKPSNLLVLDEPTNDLDIESLELLESMLVNFAGTVLVVSHDRTFVDNIASQVWMYEDNGQIVEFVGGYDDYSLFKKNKGCKEVELKSKSAEKKPPKKKPRKLSYNEQRELKELPRKIEKLELTIQTMQEELMTDNFYLQNEDQLKKFTLTLKEQEDNLEVLYQRWQQLENQ